MHKLKWKLMLLKQWAQYRCSGAVHLMHEFCGGWKQKFESFISQASLIRIFSKLLSCLWVNHEWPPPRVCDNDSVIHRELVLGKSSYLPLADSNWFSQGVHQGKLFRALDAIDVARGLPVTDDGFPEQDQRCGTNTLFETKSSLLLTKKVCG